MLTPQQLPIVFIHNGNSDYLPYSLYQVRGTNPKNPIFLIGDKWNRTYNKVVTHQLYTNYNVLANAFAKHYKHFSTNGYDYELFCIQRWFILLEFMQKNKLEQCLYLDSDILYFSDACKEQEQTKAFGLTSVTKSPHTNYINNRAALEEFCSYITHCYSTSEGQQLLDLYLEEHTAIHGILGGISDMTFFLQYRKKYPERMLDLSQIINQTTYDITIDTANGFETEASGLKKVRFQDNQPFCTQLSGQEVRYVTLHFQGKSKMHIGDYVKDVPANFKSTLSSYSLERKFQKVLSKIFK